VVPICLLPKRYLNWSFVGKTADLAGFGISNIGKYFHLQYISESASPNGSTAKGRRWLVGRFKLHKSFSFSCVIIDER
jgi:hypothetical protein